jgi:hypothetical protein
MTTRFWRCWSSWRRRRQLRASWVRVGRGLVFLPNRGLRLVGGFRVIPRPVIWSWLVLRGPERWELGGVSVRGDVDREPCCLATARRIGIERLSGLSAARRWRRAVATGRGAPARFALRSIASTIPVDLLTSRGGRPALGGSSGWPAFVMDTPLHFQIDSSLGSMLHEPLHRPGSTYFPTLAAAAR